jgi:hypothetical protein
MARFRDMRKFVRFVKDEHLATVQKSGGARFPHNMTWDFEWISADVAREKYAEQESKTIFQVSDIIDDCIDFSYLQYSKVHQARHDFTLILTPKGRHLLMKLGLVREIAKDNSEWINLVAAFLVGLVTACLAGYFSVWVTDHTKPPAITNNNYDQTTSVKNGQNTAKH